MKKTLGSGKAPRQRSARSHRRHGLAYRARALVRVVPTSTTKGQGSRPSQKVKVNPKCLKSLAGSLKKQGKRYRRELKRCQEQFSEESIHDARVHARRLLSTIQLLGAILPRFSVKKVHDRLKLQLDAFDELRDTQVQISTVAKMCHSFPAARPFYEFLLDRENRLRKHTRKSIRHVRKKGLGKLIDSWRDSLKSARRDFPPERAARALLRTVDHTFGRVCDLKARINPLDPRTIHRTRVAFKRFRYMVEALAPCIPNSNQELLREMHHYQGMMGDIQDAQVLLRTFDKYLRKHGSESQAALRFREEVLRRRQWLIQVYLEAADQLFQFWPPDPAIKTRAPQVQ